MLVADDSVTKLNKTTNINVIASIFFIGFSFLLSRFFLCAFAWHLSEKQTESEIVKHINFNWNQCKKRTSRLIISPAHAPTETILIRPLHNREPHQYHQRAKPNRASLGRYMALPPIIACQIGILSA